MSLCELLAGLQCYLMGYSDVDQELTEADLLYPDDAKIFKRHFSDTVASLKRVHSAVNLTTAESDKGEVDSFRNGLYRRAFNDGVREVLFNLGPLFTEIEKIVLEDPNFSLISIVAKLDPLSVTVDALDEGIAELESKQISGCLILALCDTYCQLGTPHVQAAYKTIYSNCLKVFLKQTSNWMLTAELYDPYCEYFIATEFDAYQDDDCVSTTTTTASTFSLDTLDQTDTARYKIALDKLPSFLSYSVAKKVLFVGESLILVKKTGREPDNFSEEERRIVDQCGLDHYEVFKKIHELQKGEIPITVDSFDDFITGVFMEANRNLRELAVKVGKVDKQIALVRDLYFLGRGELFQEFILEAEAYLNQSVNKVKCRSLLNSFTNAFYNVYLTEVSEILDAVNFSLPPRKTVPDSVTTLDCLSLVVKTNWPLGRIFTPPVISVYRQSFTYLLKMKKAQITLSKIWVEMKQDEGRRSRAVILLMAKLKFFMSNLLQYCFSDVIASEMHALTSSVSNAVTYTDIQKSVEKFTNNISDYLFLTSSQTDIWAPDDDSDSECGTTKNKSTSDSRKRYIHEILSEIFSCCQDLWKSVKDPKVFETSLVVDIEKRTDKAIRSLMQLCAQHPSDDTLSNLRRRLDYSNFFAVPRE